MKETTFRELVRETFEEGTQFRGDSLVSKLLSALPSGLRAYVLEPWEVDGALSLALEVIRKYRGYDSYPIPRMKEELERKLEDCGIPKQVSSLLSEEVFYNFSRYFPCLSGKEKDDKLIIVANLPLVSVCSNLTDYVFLHAKLGGKVDLASIVHEAIHAGKIDYSFMSYLAESPKEFAKESSIRVKKEGNKTFLVIDILPPFREDENTYTYYGYPNNISISIIGGKYNPREIFTELLNAVILEKSGVERAIEERKKLLEKELEIIEKFPPSCSGRREDVMSYLYGIYLSEKPSIERMVKGFIEEYLWKSTLIILKLKKEEEKYIEKNQQKKIFECYKEYFPVVPKYN